MSSILRKRKVLVNLLVLFLKVGLRGEFRFLFLNEDINIIYV